MHQRESVYSHIGDAPGRPLSHMTEDAGKVDTHTLPPQEDSSHMQLPQIKHGYRRMCERGCKCLLTQGGRMSSEGICFSCWNAIAASVSDLAVSIEVLHCC